MKKTLLYIGIAMLSVTGFTACDDDWQRPPIPEQTPVEQIEANITLLELKEAFYNPEASDYATEIGTNADGEHYIVRGRVVSNDETGNIFKSLMIEDETAGMAFSVNISKLYQYYKFGQEVAIDVTGLYIGAYGRNMQIGAKPADRDYPSRIEEDDFKAVALVQSDPHPELVVAHEVTMDQLAQFNQNTTEMLAWQNRFVVLKDMHFENPGQPMGETQTTVSRYVADAQGQRIQMRNSGYSTWWAQLQPDGTGSIKAVLSYFNRSWQLMLNDYEDLEGFTPAKPIEPVVGGDGSKNDPYTVAQLLQQGAPSVAEANKWVKGYIVGFIPDKSLAEAIFSADGAVATNIVIGATADASSATAVLPVQLPSGAIRSGLNLKDNPGLLGKEVLLQGSVEKYFGACGVKSVTAAIVDGKTIGEEGGDTPGPIGDAIFSETFATSQGSFTIENILLPDGLTYIWSQDANYKCMKASAFADNTNHDADSRLISPEIDLTGYKAVAAAFDQACNFFADIETARKEAAFEVSDDNGATWTALTVPGFPGSLSWTFANSGSIDLSAYAGKKIKVAFHYTGTATKCGTWEVKNLVVSGSK